MDVCGLLPSLLLDVLVFDRMEHDFVWYGWRHSRKSLDNQQTKFIIN